MSFVEEVPITKVAVSHVVGRGGETIKQLKASTNTNIDIVDDKVRITGESEEAVKKCRKLVEDIIAEQANPDYEGPEGKRLRAEADAIGIRRDELKKEAQAKFDAGDKDAGHKLMAEVKQLTEDLHAKNKEAAAAIVKNRNEGRGDSYLDLHGLRTEEALEVTKERIAELETKPEGVSTELELIPGAGHHSAPGKIALKPACANLLRELNLPYKDASAGSFLVIVLGKGNKPAPGAAVTQPAAAAPAASSGQAPSSAPAPAATATSQPAQEKKPAEKKEKKHGCCTIM